MTSYFNHKHYPDPTAYEAEKNMEHERLREWKSIRLPPKRGEPVLDNRERQRIYKTKHNER